MRSSSSLRISLFELAVAELARFGFWGLWGSGSDNEWGKIMGGTLLVCHGAWSAGWAWKKMHPLMQAAGHRLVTPSYTGLGERAHLAHPSIDLETHIQDTLNVIRYEDLRDVVLIGHSYGGMVATGVADRARDRVTQLIYIDAFVPRDGQSLFDLNESGRQHLQQAADNGDG